VLRDQSKRAKLNVGIQVLALYHSIAYGVKNFSQHPRRRFAICNLPRLRGSEDPGNGCTDHEVVREARYPEASTLEAGTQELQPERGVRDVVEVVVDTGPDFETSDKSLERKDSSVNDGREDCARATCFPAVSPGSPASVDIEIVDGEALTAAVVDEEVPLEAPSASDGSGKR